MSEAFERAVKHAFETDWSDLGIEESKEGLLHFPDTLQRRKANGSLQSVEIMLRVPGNMQRVHARKRSRKMLDELELDKDEDRDFLEELEKYELLAYAMRDRKPPYVQHVPDGMSLWKSYDLTSLGKLNTRLALITEACDPRYGELTADEIWKVAMRIAAGGSASPLADIAGFDQATCITFLAREALKSPTAPSWAQSPSTSKPATETSSSPSSTS